MDSKRRLSLKVAKNNLLADTRGTTAKSVVGTITPGNLKAHQRLPMRRFFCVRVMVDCAEPLRRAGFLESGGDNSVRSATTRLSPLGSGYETKLKEAVMANSTTPKSNVINLFPAKKSQRDEQMMACVDALFAVTKTIPNKDCHDEFFRLCIKWLINIILESGELGHTS